MTHNFLTKSQLDTFYNGRRKLDQAITQLFGNDVHLHDISQSSEISSNSTQNNEELPQMFNQNRKSGQEKGNYFGNPYSPSSNNQVRNIGSTPNLNPNPNPNPNPIKTQPTPTSPLTLTSPSPSPPNPNPTTYPKPHSFQTFYQNLQSQSKYDKLYKDHIQLQKKLTTIQTESQSYKTKANLWEKLKEYIYNCFSKEYQMKSIQYRCGGDAVVLEEFLAVLEEVGKRGKIGKERKDGKEGKESEDGLYKNLYEDMKKKYEQQSKKSLKLMLDLQILKNENINLKQKQSSINNHRLSRINQLSLGIEQKYNQHQQNLQQKVQENKLLYSKISKLQSQIIELKANLRKKDKTISTNPETVADLYPYPYPNPKPSPPSDKPNQILDIDIFTKISKQKDNEINKLKQENKTLHGRFVSVQINNQKMKNVIKLAQTLNNQFMEKLEESMLRKREGEGEVEMGMGMSLGRGSGSRGYEDVSLEYQIGRDRRGFDSSVQQDFHMTNQRFKIVKSRSLGKQKQRYMYGKTTKK